MAFLDRDDNEFLALLDRYKITGHKFAKRTGIPRSTVYDWALHGISRPSDKLLIQYIDKYGFLTTPGKGRKGK